MSDEIYIPFATNASQAAGEIRRAANETDRAARSADRFGREQRDVGKETDKATRDLREHLRELNKVNRGYDRMRRSRSVGSTVRPGSGGQMQQRLRAGREALSQAGSVGGPIGTG